MEQKFAGFRGNLRNFKLVDMMEILRDSFYLNDKNCKTLLISRCFLTKDCFNMIVANTRALYFDFFL